MNILFVTTDAYPYFGTTSNLIDKLLGGGVKSHNKIGVLSICNQYSDKSHEIVKDVEIFRAPSYEYIHGIDYIKHIVKYSVNEIIGSFAEKVIYTLRIKFSPGDHLIRDYNVRVLSQSIEYLTQERYDVVIAISGNYDSVVALSVADTNAKKVFWQVDPCSTNLLRLPSEYYNSLALEKLILKVFDAIFTPKLYYDELVKLHKRDISDNLHILEFPLIDKRETYIKDNNMKTKHCVFSGLIYSGIRDPRYTIKLFAEMNNPNICLDFVGVSFEEIPSDLRRYVNCHGRVEMSVATSYVDSADFLVNIGNKMNNQIPSKLFEYISTGKPIINICKNRDCPSLDILKNYPLVINLFEEEDKFELQVIKLNEFIDKMIGKRVKFNYLEDNYRKYMPEYCAEVIKSVLYNL